MKLIMRVSVGKYGLFVNTCVTLARSNFIKYKKFFMFLLIKDNCFVMLTQIGFKDYRQGFKRHPVTLKVY